ncbi:MAG: hypothetical protein GKR93_13565 [Gammaproteobacteria bacterium]|nr:hypothetical protein [Gammaproteobacteria bacterium]
MKDEGVTNSGSGQNSQAVPEAQIAAVLEHQFGAGIAQLPRQRPAKLLELAQKHGFIDGAGYLTRKGRALLARYH